MGLPPFTPSSVLTEWMIDPVALALLVVAGWAYAAGVRRLDERGRRWSPGRTTAYFSGLGALLVATQSGLAAYDTTLFSAHVAQHVLLGIVGPFLLALGAPVTLALQASPRHTQVVLLRTLRSSPVRTLTHPLVAWTLFGLSLFVLYYSPIYELSLESSMVHTWVHLHFVVVGSLFFWVTIGLDPVSWRVPYPARLLLVLLIVPFHAFLGIALASASEPLASSWYAAHHPPWAVSALADQRTGAAIMWAVGDFVGLVTAGVIVVQWMRHDERATRRLDRRLDALDADPAPFVEGRR